MLIIRMAAFSPNNNNISTSEERESSAASPEGRLSCQVTLYSGEDGGCVVPGNIPKQKAAVFWCSLTCSLSIVLS